MKTGVQEELKKRQKQQDILIQRSKLESLGKLAAGIAHEINQPLAGISMGLDNVLLKISSGKPTGDYLKNKVNVLHGYIDRIRHIIDHIRTFSREQTSLSVEKIDISEVCRNALPILRTQYDHHQIILRLSTDPTVGFVIGNKYKLEQVVLNLISNARDAVEEKEKIIDDPNYQKEIKISTFYDDEKICLEVEDNGTGISEEDRNNIFDPFFTTKDPESGTGLGLSISYGIIREMNGEIRVRSHVNEYTVMRVILPKVDYGQSENSDS
ncbi:ATP-binding protein [Desulfococcaceae bacterium HSG8]|nr:ATP-binding protein [Desulfococcaceae bacterium HSG8]